MDQSGEGGRTRARVGDAALDGLLALTRLAASAPPEQVIATAARAISAALGYRTVVVNLYRPAFHDLRVAVVEGAPEARALLLGRITRFEAWIPLLDDRFFRAGAYLVSHDQHDWDQAEHPTYIPELDVEEHEDAWHPEDALFVPLRASSGDLLGTLSVDEPANRRRPDTGQLEVLVSFASHVSAALERANAVADAARRGREVEALLQVSGRLSRERSAEGVLDVVCDGIRDALGFEKVTGYLVTDDGELRRSAQRGWGDEDGAPATLPIAGITPLLDPALLREGCSLLSNDDAKALTPAALHGLYESERNGRGVHAWREHWLIVPLRDTEDALVGIIWADEPRDHRVPDTGRLRALRLFADQATGAIEAARRGAALRASEQLHRSVVDALDEGVIVLDEDGYVIACNDSATDVIGITAEQLVGMRPPFVPAFLEDGTPMSEAESPTLISLRTGEMLAPAVLRLLRPDGEDRWISINRRRLEGGGGLVASFSDITERRSHERQIAHMAFHDALTGLANRAKLEDHLASALARARRDDDTAAVLYIDLDDFKAVNDSLDHAAGDEVLRQVAHRLGARVRGGDLLARQGGDEFLVLLPALGIDPDRAAEAVARDLLTQLEIPFKVGSAVFEVGASVGVAIYPRDGEYSPELLRHADAALHQAKHAGGRTVAFYRREADDARGRLTASARLRRALLEDELLLHYQPIVGLECGTVVGVEALVRWRDPERGLIAPAEFIPLAERSGLIDALGDWVLDAALARSRAWAQDGLEPIMAVNVSPSQLRRPDFVDRVFDALEHHEVDPRRLCLEVTESAAMREAERTAPVLGALRERGVRIAIDDFGADFSSLSRLRDLPVDVLKLDRAFLRGVPDTAEAGAMVTAMVSLGESLGLTTIAEGVESAEQQEFLRVCGCTLAQGFHLGRPVAAELATRVLTEARGALHSLK